MEFELRNIGYLEGARVVTVTLSAKDKQGVDQPIQAQWPANDVPELASLVTKAIEQVGGELVLKVMDADDAAKTTPDEPAPITVNVVKGSDTEAVVNKHVQQLLDERAERKRIAEEEARAAEEALNRTEDSN